MKDENGESHERAAKTGSGNIDAQMEATHEAFQVIRKSLSELQGFYVDASNIQETIIYCRSVWDLSHIPERMESVRGPLSKALVNALAAVEAAEQYKNVSYGDSVTLRDLKLLASESVPRRLSVMREQHEYAMLIKKLIEPLEQRLAAARRAKGRFKGRSHLEQEAERGNLFALAKLESILKLTSDPVEFEIVAVERALSDLCCLLARLIKVEWPSQRLDNNVFRMIREHREKQKLGAPNPKPGRIYLMQAKRKILGVFRTCEHSHENRWTIVDHLDDVRAVSKTGTVSSSSVGMSKAYCRTQYTVAHSEHHFFLSTKYMPYKKGEYVYLSPSCRVRQGRGSSLVTERRLASGSWK